MNHAHKVCVVIPAYNEENSVISVIRKVRNFLPHTDIVVVNDGSNDLTSNRARSEGVRVIDIPFNLGIGGSVQTGLKYAYRYGYDVVVEIDADGQHDPSFAPQLINTLLKDNSVNMVIGSRFIADTDYRSSKLRKFGIHTFSFLIKLVTKKRVYDSTSGFRAYDRKALRVLSKKYPADFPEPESIVMLLNERMGIREIPVVMATRTQGTSVVGRDMSFRAAYYVLSNAIAILISGYKTKG